MLLRQTTYALAILLGTTHSAWSQSPPPPPAPAVDAGSLLEQQRRQQPAPPPPANESGVLPAAPQRPATEAGAASLTQTTVLRFDVTGNVLLDNAAVQAALAPWLNRPEGLPGLRQAAAALEDAYRARGWVARVTLPAQDITDGTVRLAVTESRLGRILLQQGAEPLGAVLTARVQAMLEHQLPAGQPLSLHALERALLLADDLPGVRVQGSLQAGESPGSTDVVVALSPGMPYRGEANADNGGNRATGIERINAQLQVLSPLGQGEQFSLGASASRGSQYLSLGAGAPLPGVLGADGWRIVGSASVLRYQVLDSRNTTTGLAPDGSSNTLGAGLQYPLVRTALANWQLYAGLAQTRLNNRDDNVVLNQRDTTSHSRSSALQLSLSGNQFDRWAGGGANSASLALTHGHLSLDGSPASYLYADAQTTATQGSYSKLRWSASRLQTLASSTSLLASATGQLASGNLDPSEKLYLGGMYGVRAYPNGEAGGSAGTQISLELRQDLSPQWQASAFYDWGQVQLYKNNRFTASANPLVARNDVTLKGAGLALAWRGEHGAQIKASWARRIGNNPLATANGNDSDGSLHKNRIWLNGSIAF